MISKTMKRLAVVATGTGPKAEVEALRIKRLELLEQKKTVDGIRRPLAEAEHLLDQLLDGLAADLDVNLSALADHRARGLPEILRPGTEIGLRLNDKTLLALLVASNRSGVREALAKVLRTGYEHGDTLTAGDREAKLNAIDAELDDLEHREEALIRQSEIDGTPLLRRDDADPAVVLLAEVAA